jgi:hypothetical protein
VWPNALITGDWTAMQMQGKSESYFKSRFFRKLFLSYALIIVLFVAGFCAWYIHSYRVNTRSMARENCIQRANAFCT